MIWIVTYDSHLSEPLTKNYPISGDQMIMNPAPSFHPVKLLIETFHTVLTLLNLEVGTTLRSLLLMVMGLVEWKYGRIGRH